MEKVCVGMQIDIARSDGRIHGALVTKVTPQTRMISVEWFEKGETKGKEVDFVSILKTNPNLMNGVPGVPPSPLTPAAGEPRTPRHSVASAQPVQKFVFDQKKAANVTFQPEVLNENKAKERVHKIKESSANATTILQPAKSRRTERIIKKLNVNKPNELETIEEPMEVDDVPAALPPLPLAPSKNNDIGQQAPAAKSQVVANMEALEKNREQRRAQLAEAKKQREQQMAIDPGNPNWEFLSKIQEYKAQIDYRPLKATDQVLDNRICVCVRKRPMSQAELAKREIEVVTVPNKDHVIVHQPQVKVDLTKYLVNQKFRFDYTFEHTVTNEMVYKFTAKPLVQTIFQRGFATCFAYGQTGSGKTHTMGGSFEGRQQQWTNGIYALTASDVFDTLKRPEHRREGLYVVCSFFEIYSAKVFDLLGKKAKLQVLEDGKKAVQIVGLKEMRANSVDEVLKLIKQGSEQRTAGQTSANSNSSRSHAVFQIILRKNDGKTDQLYGKFSLIDLAGNERGADTMNSDRQTRLEGAEINKSLLALKECIRAMGRDEQHVPFRGSKLTLILRDSFVGKNAKTCMIAMISPGMGCVENTMNTLRYADRVKELGSEDVTTPMGDDELMLPATDGKAPTNDYNLQQQQQQDLVGTRGAREAFQAAIEAVCEAEDVAIDEHRGLMACIHQAAKALDGMLKKADRGGDDYEVEEYAKSCLKLTRELYKKAGDAMVRFEDLERKIKLEGAGKA